MRATVSICCSPPLMRPPGRSRHLAEIRETARRAARASSAARRCRRASGAGWRPTSRFSITVRSAKMRRSSGTKPRPRRAISYGSAPRDVVAAKRQLAAAPASSPSPLSSSSTCRRRCGPSARRLRRARPPGRRRTGSAPRRTTRSGRATSSSGSVIGAHRCLVAAPAAPYAALLLEGLAGAEIDLLHLRVVADRRPASPSAISRPRASTIMRSA